MAFESFAGNFALNTSTGNQSITGVSFQPKIVIFYNSFLTADGIAVDNMFAVGAAISSSSRFAISANSEDGQATSDSISSMVTDACIRQTIAGVTTVTYEADFVSQDIDGFTINISTPPASAFRIGFMALGGDDLTNVFIGNHQFSAGLGNQFITGVGFKPDACMFFATSNDNTIPDNNNLMTPLIGYAKSPTSRASLAVFSANGVGTSDTKRLQRTDKCMVAYLNTGLVRYEIDFVSQDSDGFTIDVTDDTGSNNRIFQFICLKGGQYEIGSFNSRTVTGTFPTAGVGFKPTGAIFTSFLSPANSGIIDENKWSLGIASSPTEQFSAGGTDEDNQATTDADNFSDDNRIYLNYDFAQTKLGDISFISFNTDGFTLDQEDADPIANEILYFVFGGDAIPPPVIPAIRGLPTRHESTGLCVIIQDPIVFSDRTSYGRFSQEIQNLSFSTKFIGGFWDAKLKINYPLSEIESWIESGGATGLGRHIQIFNPSLSVIWEGFVNGISATLGGVTYKIGSLKEINNRVAVTFSATDTSITPPVVGARETTADADDTDSQALYGIIEKTIPKGSTTSTLADQGRDAWLEDRQSPQTNTKDNVSGSSGPSLQLECLGYWHWFDLYTFEDLVGGDVNLSAFIQTIVSAQLNSIISTDFMRVSSNTLQVPTYNDKHPKASSLLKTLNSFGDVSNNLYTIGVYQDRQIVYEQIPENFDYQRRITSNSNILDRLQGSIDPWDILPGRWIFYPDFLSGRFPPISAAALSTDPRATLIQNMKFTAPNKVSISGERIGTSPQVFAKFGLVGQGT